MAHDIFMSYSRKDSEQALALAERLRGEGISVWIDRDGIAGAQSWATEIVEGINNCKTFLILLSPNGISSEHVLRELHLALEKKKRILPVDLLTTVTELPTAFQYPLAGLQRVQVSDFARIIEGYTSGVVRKETARRDRHSLMVLPFEDLSPSQDNAWFADGLAGELISSLSAIKSLRVIDKQTSMAFKTVKVKTTYIAQELEVRYFLEGSVRKAGNQIRISIELLDIETGEYLWQLKHTGTMDDIFQVQEEIAEKVIEGLQLHTPLARQKKAVNVGTTNAEAYELRMKSAEYFQRQSREGMMLAIGQLSQALELDPLYADACSFKALVLCQLYRSYDRNPKLLEEAETLAKRVLEIDPDQADVYDSLSNVYRLQGRLKEAEEAILEMVRRKPDLGRSYVTLGFYYSQTNQPEKAIPAYEKSIEIEPEYRITYWNLVRASTLVGDAERVKKWSMAALPHFERRLRLMPDDEVNRVWYANLLHFSGQPDRARAALQPLWSRSHLDGNTLFNSACLLSRLSVEDPSHKQEDTQQALAALRRAVSSGFVEVEAYRSDPDLDPLRGTPEFQEILTALQNRVTARPLPS